jgi:hypothetical protein
MYAQMQNADPKQRGGAGCCGFIYGAILLGFFSAQFVQDNALSTADQCCAVQVQGSTDYFPVACGMTIDTTIYNSVTNVSQEFLMICVWAISFQSIILFASMCMGVSVKCIPCAGLLHCIASCGSFAWLITQSVFVFRGQGIACSMTGNTLNSGFEKHWASEYTFQWRMNVALWSIFCGLCCLTCCIGCLFGSKMKQMQEEQVVYQGTLVEHETPAD